LFEPLGKEPQPKAHVTHSLVAAAVGALALAACRSGCMPEQTNDTPGVKEEKTR
jgi:hypothetical protein